MKRIATTFFATGAVSALAGMIWGIQMAASGDHTLSPAHGHLNLIGFVSMAIFGAYYALASAASSSRLAAVHYLLSVAAVVLIVPGIAMAVTGSGETIAKIGSVLAVASMALFAFMVLRYGTDAERAGTASQ